MHALGIDFDTRYVTEVSTDALIEDYQTLQKAKRLLEGGDVLGALNVIDCVCECLNDTISNYTQIPEGGFTPSGSTFVCKDVQNGLVLMNGQEPRCAGGHPFSEISQLCCDDECCHHCSCEQGGRCNPEDGLILHESGRIYTGTYDDTKVFFE